jgi:Cd2+/Zn2+-exporting ATPase
MPQRKNNQTEESFKPCPYCTVDVLEEKTENHRPYLIITISAIILLIGILMEFLFGQKLIAQLLFLIVAATSGFETIKNGITSLTQGRITINLLITIAAAGAFIIGEGAEGASVLFLFYIAEYLEDYAGERARKSIGALVKLAPDTALVKREEKDIVVHVHAVQKGETVAVKPGDKIPLDGRVIKGYSTVNQAAITGESLPINKSEGDEVYAGTINQEGYLEILVTRSSGESVISRIIKLVSESKKRKSSTEKFIDRFSRYYTPLIILLAVLISIIPPFLLGQPFDTWFYRSLVLLVVSCPCALAISTPISMVSAITSGTRNGVLIKGGEYVEELEKTEVMVFDKTGTLTQGKLEVTDIIPFDGFTLETVMSKAVSLENRSSHPLAEAVLKYADKIGIKPEDVSSFQSIPGKGVKGEINGETYYAGAFNLFESKFKEDALMRKLKESGKTMIIIASANQIMGIIGLMDTVKDSAKAAVDNLNGQGIKTVMLTGDNESTALAVSSELGLDDYYSRLLPEDKVNVIDDLLKKHKHVVMVGDGVNDAPALARSNVGIAMGAAGSDVAIETADISLMKDDLSRLNYLLKLSKRTMKIVKENVTASILIKVSFAIMAVLGLITLWMAVLIGDMGLSLAVILNALRVGQK